MLIAGVVIALHWLTFFGAIKVSNVSITLALLSTGAFFTSIMEPIFYKRKVIWYEILFGLIVICGLYIIFQGGNRICSGNCVWPCFLHFFRRFFPYQWKTGQTGRCFGDLILRTATGAGAITLYLLLCTFFGNTRKDFQQNFLMFRLQTGAIFLFWLQFVLPMLL